MTILEKALKKENLSSVPIWFMRQAGRYLPEYQKIRADKSFWQMVTTPELASEITLQPIERFDLDAAIIFSDILVILDGLGFEVSFAKGPPELDFSLETADDIIKYLDAVDITGVDKLTYYWQALEITRAKLAAEKTLIGFAAAPFTLASYMIEGNTSKFHAKVRALIYQKPELFSKLADFIAEATIRYLENQIKAGVNVIQLFDSWADILRPDVYLEHLMPHNEKIIRRISEKVPVIFFCRGASIHQNNLLGLYKAGASAISIDWRLPINFFGDAGVQGNLDPAILFSDPESVQSEANKILEARGHKPGFIFNLGHGIYPGARLENVAAMVETVRKFKV